MGAHERGGRATDGGRAIDGGLAIDPGVRPGRPSPGCTQRDESYRLVDENGGRMILKMA